MRFSKGFEGAWVVPLAVAADRLTKAWASKALPDRGAVSVLPGLLNWRYAQNTGAAFSAMSGMTGVLSLLTALLIAAVCGYLLILQRGRGPLRVGLWMLAAGGASNLFDRLTYGFVVDFIEFDFVHFAIFNVADVFICAGAALALLGYLIEERRRERANG